MPEFLVSSIFFPLRFWHRPDHENSHISIWTLPTWIMRHNLCLATQNNQTENLMQFLLKNTYFLPLIMSLDTASRSEIMLKVELRGAQWNHCSDLFRTHRVTLTQNQMCAGGEADKDSCQGHYTMNKFDFQVTVSNLDLHSIRRFWRTIDGK